MRKIRNIPRYKFPCQRFLWLPIGQYLSLVFPLKTGGIEPFFALLAVFAPAACRWGCRPLAKGAGRGRCMAGRKAGYQLHGGEGGTAGLKRASRRTGEWCTPKKACGRLGGARGRRDRSSVARDGGMDVGRLINQAAKSAP